jgi:cytoskeletal protein RodZ
MKKVVLSAFAFAMFGVATVNAQTTPPSQSPTTTQKQTQDTTKTSTATAPTASTAPAEDVKTAITVEELPAAVKTTLASPSLKVWTPYEAYLIKEKDGDEYFAINIKKDTQTGSVKLDKEGKPVK